MTRKRTTDRNTIETLPAQEDKQTINLNLIWIFKEEIESL